MGLQKWGDLNDDKLVDIQDFNLLKGGFGQGGAPRGFLLFAGESPTRKEAFRC